MKIFVTGATGFVGTAVVKALLQRNHEVVGLVRGGGKGKALEQLGMTSVIGDMLEPSSYVGTVQTVDVVINTAQYAIQGRFTQKKLKQIEYADILMTKALSQACLEYNKTFIYTSGCFNYGDCGDEWITEQTPLNPSPLGQAHTAMQKMLLALHQEKQLRVIIVVPVFVYGPGGLFKQSFYDTLQKGQLRVFGNGKNYWSIVHVEDLALAYALAAESEMYGEVYNVVDDQPLQLREMVNLFTDAMEKKRVGSMAPWLLKLIIGGPLVDSLVTSFRLNNQKIKEKLHWQPHYPTFQDGLPGVLKALESKQ